MGVIDLQGQRFGMLLVTRREGSDWRNNATWFCDCDCGKKDVIIKGSNLRIGVTNSCGCMIAPSIIGQKFNLLTVISEYINDKGDKYCLCKCDCGNEKNILRGHLLDSSIKSCGCLKHVTEDLTGQRFGRLVVLKRNRVDKNRNIYWLCHCDCGNEKEIMGRSLKYGTTLSCGCYQKEQNLAKFEDLTGQRFGRLIALELIRKINSKGKSKNYWKCICDCGKEKISLARMLKAGKCQSCGCLHKEKLKEAITKELGEAAFYRIYLAYMRGAEDRKLEFSLSIEQVKELIDQNCSYCGSKPSNLSKSLNNTGDYIYNGIDRVDNSLGYIISNVVSCCYECNWSKRNRTKDNFLSWIKNVYEYSIMKEKGIN